MRHRNTFEAGVTSEAIALGHWIESTINTPTDLSVSSRLSMEPVAQLKACGVGGCNQQ